MFYDENYGTKLSYTDYCCITEDFSTENIDEEALKVCENFGFPRQYMIKCLNRGDLNHATACYYLLTNAGWKKSITLIKMVDQQTLTLKIE